MEPLISILIPAYNAGKFIKQTIKSVLKQTYDNWELIIINDGSIDDTEKKIKSFNNDKIRYFFQENMGCMPTRKSLLKKVRGDYFTFVDADDLIHPQMLEIFVWILNNCKDIPDIIMNKEIQNVSKKFTIGVNNNKINDSEIVYEYIKKEELYDNFIYSSKYNVGPTSKLYSRKLITNDIEELPTIFVGEDTCMNLLFSLNSNKIIGVDNRLYFYRYGGFSTRFYPALIKDLSNLYEWRKKIIRNNKLDKSLELKNLLNVITLYMSLSQNVCINKCELLKDFKPVLDDIELNKDSINIKFFQELDSKEYAVVPKQKESMIIILKTLILNYF